MLLDSSDAIISWCLLKHGIFEPAETAVLKAILRAGDIFVDCGANIGYYTLLAADIVGEEGHVYAFEPVPDNYRLLLANIAHNQLQKRITAYELALGARDQSAKMHLDRINKGAHSLHATNLSEAENIIEVTERPLDSILAHANVIKLDTQGAEPDIIAGAINLIARSKPVLILEWWPWGLRHRGPRATADFAEALGSFGYYSGVILEGGLVEISAWARIAERYSVQDKDFAPTVLCSPRPLSELLPAGMILRE